jgi:uncharacterized OsmC-like protein
VTVKLEFSVTAKRVDASASVAACKDATLTLDTALAGRRDALNPAELLLAALSACMIKGIERVAPMLKFSFRGVEVRVHGVRQDVPLTGADAPRSHSETPSCPRTPNT